MTIELINNSPRDSYTVTNGNTQALFDVTFEFFDSTDLKVYTDGTLQSSSTYSVAGGDGAIGSITFTTPIVGTTAGVKVVITREIPLQRTTDFPTSGAFNIGTLNTELDRFIAIAADLNDSINRSLVLNTTDSDATLTLPTLDDRIGNTLAFDATTGNAIAGPSITQVNNVIANVAQASTDATTATTQAGIATTKASEALQSATDAAASLASANLPTSFTGNSGKIIQVNSGETAYEFATSATNNGVFYGLRIDTSTGHLVVDSSTLGGSEAFTLSNYDNYFFSSPNVTFSLDTSGDLILTTP